MSNTKQDGHLRLVPLVATLARIEKPSLNKDQIFDLALKGEVRLYARLPSDKVAYVDMFLPIVTHRRSSVFMRDMGDFTRYNPLSDKIHPEITHVALDSDQAGELKTKTTKETGTTKKTGATKKIETTEDDAFGSGLMQHPDGTLAQAGWLLPCEFGGSIVICPTPPGSEAEKKLQRVRRTSITITADDVYIDERITALLEGSKPANPKDPFMHGDRAPGIYALFCAARDYYHAIAAKKVTFEEAKGKLIEKIPWLLSTDADHVAKFINPRYHRNSGVQSKDRKDLDKSVLEDPAFIAKYKQHTFVRAELALILYVTDRWLAGYAKFKAGETARPPAGSVVADNFLKLGFYPKELKALTNLVLLGAFPASPTRPLPP